jgi:RNA polymerase sigma-70 factor (ECF subfamily)
MATSVAPSSGDEAAADEPQAQRSARIKQFLRLFLQNEHRLYAYILTLLPHRPDADDVLQEASMVMWDKFDQAAPPVNFAAWGCRIAYFKVLEHAKRKRRGRVFFSQAMIDRAAETAVEQAVTLELDERRDASSDMPNRPSVIQRPMLGS